MTALLLTRPQPAAQRFLDLFTDAEHLGWQVMQSPLLEIVPQPMRQDPASVAGVIFTSSNAVEIASRETKARGHAFCVGRRTTDLAVQLGWQARCLGQTAEELVEAVHATPVAGALLHLHGEHTRGRVAARLRDAGQDCLEEVIYKQRLLSLSKQARNALGAEEPVIVPLFSPRTAQHFADQVTAAQNLHLVAISRAVAEPLTALRAEDLLVAKKPDAAAMAGLVRDVAGRLARVEGGKRAH